MNLAEQQRVETGTSEANLWKAIEELRNRLDRIERALRTGDHMKYLGVTPR